MAFASLLIMLLAISSSAVALTGPLATTANRGWREGGRGRRQGEQEEHPYVFHKSSFRTRASSEAGEIRDLPNFEEVSELLEGIGKFRVTYIELKPNAVLLPHYIDAKRIFYVAQGRGYIAYVQQNELVKRNLEEGDVFGVPTGRTFYLVNSDNQNSMRIANILRTESPFRGEYQPFFVTGGRNPQTVYSAFSDDVLQAAFNTNMEQLERVFSGQNRGVIIYANEEQIRELSSRRGTSARFSSSSEQPRPFNLRNQKPEFENENGRFTEAGPKDNPFLESFDASVALIDLKAGAMSAPFFNSKSTAVVMVLDGEGRLEIACPHLGEHGRSSQGEKGEQRIAYQKVRADLRPGTVYVVPAGHPFTEIASTNSRLQIIRFNINAHHNERQFLAGKNNVLHMLEREIRQISFDTQHREEIEQVLSAQRDQVILRGPQQQGSEERRSSA